MDISAAFFLLIGPIQNGFQRFEEHRLEPDLVRSQGRVPEGAEWYDALFAAQWRLKGINANAGELISCHELYRDGVKGLLWQ